MQRVRYPYSDINIAHSLPVVEHFHFHFLLASLMIEPPCAYFFRSIPQHMSVVEIADASHDMKRVEVILSQLGHNFEVHY